MASLLSLQRELQILRVRLKAKKRALEIVPSDQKLQLDIIDLEGQIEEVATNIQFEEEDITKKPKERHTAKHNHEQPRQTAGLETSQIKIGNLTPLSDHHQPGISTTDPEGYTLQNVNAIVDGKIWDFRNREFVILDMRNNPKRCQELLYKYANKLLKATYYTKHLCRQEDIESHIPLDTILQVFDKNKWDEKLEAIQKHLHERILTKKLVDEIMIREWQNWSSYPKRTPGYIEADKDTRIQTFKSYVNKESLTTTYLMAPLAESIDWVTIRKAATPNHQQLYYWTQACLIMAAETAFVLGRDIKDPKTGKRQGGNATAFKMNRKWEMFAEDEEWKPRLDSIPTPINREFGNGMHTSIKNVPVTLPPWDESDGHEDILAPYTKPKLVVRPKKSLERAESQNESNKPTRQKRTKPSEMTADDHARKRRRTKGISARNILREPVKSGGLAGLFETKNSLEGGAMPETGGGQIRGLVKQERDSGWVEIQEELIK